MHVLQDRFASPAFKQPERARCRVAHMACACLTVRGICRAWGDDFSDVRQLVLDKSKELAFSPVTLCHDEQVSGSIDWALVHKVEELADGNSPTSEKASSSSSHMSLPLNNVV